MRLRVHDLEEELKTEREANRSLFIPQVGLFSKEEYDPDRQGLIDAFCRWTETNFHDPSQCWDAIDKNHQRIVTRELMFEELAKFGWNLNEAEEKKLWWALTKGTESYTLKSWLICRCFQVRLGTGSKLAQKDFYAVLNSSKERTSGIPTGRMGDSNVGLVRL